VESPLNAKPQLNNPGLGTTDSRLLVRQAQSGNLRAFEEIVVIYQEKIVTLSYYLTGNRTDAQDLAQEVFVRAYTKLGSFRQDSDLGTWLHRVTMNLWSNMKRRQRFPNLVSLDDPVRSEEGEFTRNVASDDHESNPQEAFEGKELQKTVQQALQNLSEEFRIVLVLREIEGYSYEEIATITKSSLGTVKSRINRARQALRKQLADIDSEVR
jgi:RNA polymerase sigma-70 factor (ECF subfamily)